MQVIILAAGMGKRLGILTQHNTKCMVKVQGVTLIERLLRQLSEAGLKKVIIVSGYYAENLVSLIGDNYLGMQINYVNNPIYDKTNNIYSLALAKDYLIEDDTLLFESDLIFEDSIIYDVLNCPAKNAVTVAKFESWMDGTVVTLDEDNTILSFVPKAGFVFDHIDTYFKTVNIYKLSKEFSANFYVPFLEAYTKAVGNNEYYEEVLRVITFLDRAKLTAIRLKDQKWYEIDDMQDLDIAETIFSKPEEKMHNYHKRYGGYWRFPELVDFCYLVNPYFPPKRLINEMKCNFQILMESYPSGMNVNKLLAAKFFGISSDEIIVGNGASELIAALLEYSKCRTGIMLPTFEEYTNRMPKELLKVGLPSNNDFTYTIEDLEKLTVGVEQLIIVNPNNPTGQLIPISDLLKLIKRLEVLNKRVILDESFIDFSESESNNSLLNSRLLENYPNLIVVKSISKSYGVPGFRLGVLATSNKNLLDAIKSKLPVWNINSYGEFFMQIFNKYESSYHNACKSFEKERNRFLQELQRIEFLRVIPSKANFFLCEVKIPHNSKSLTDQLLVKYNILIKDCSAKQGFEGKSFVRIAVRNKTDNDKLINVLSNVDLN
jgi:histidinol-phosphate/aromatic aminotransferase/cobyric acid decarboxylase-like protein/choline kinase